MLLLTFIGQAIAAVAVSCPEMDQKSHHQMTTYQQKSTHQQIRADSDSLTMARMQQSQDSVQHSGMSMDLMADCCDPDCHCPMGSCVSASLAATSTINHFELLPERFSDAIFLAISQPPTSPYYPPIFS